jgi:hypothetical protein
VVERVSSGVVLVFGGLLLVSPACSRVASSSDERGESESEDGGDGDGDPGDGDPGDGDGDPGDTGPCCIQDVGGGDTDEPGCSNGDGPCNQIDLLFVVDNSGTMGEEQLNLAAALPLLIDKLHAMLDGMGDPLHPDVNIMFTTTDVGHPECTTLQPDGYEPAQGAPQGEACIDRLDDFTGLGSDPLTFAEACTSGCPVAVEPVDSFIHFEGPMGTTTNVPANNLAGALSCIGPQGINGCGYEAPLEAMLLAIDPDATWNQGNKPFLREGAILAVTIITDDDDCSVRAPEGYAYFTDQSLNTYWEVNPDTGTKTHATSAVCWNSGVNCGAPDSNGIYADCESVDNGVLHPLSRYLDRLQSRDTPVLMLGILGVPSVTAHSPSPPFQPTAGGVEDLVYREWKDGAYPEGDLLATDEGATAASKEFEFGIGPGCTGEDGSGGFTGQAMPPVRIKEVCEGLNDNDDDQLYCCIESVCDNDFSAGLSCLTGMLQTAIDPIQ